MVSPEGFSANPELVFEFYNQRRRQLSSPNLTKGTWPLPGWKRSEVHIVTQNVDDLHERAGSTNVLHLHGEIRKPAPWHALTWLSPLSALS